MSTTCKAGDLTLTGTVVMGTGVMIGTRGVLSVLEAMIAGTPISYSDDQNGWM